MKSWFGGTALLVVLAAAVPALAGQSEPSVDFSASLPPPADRGRPMIYVPPDVGPPQTAGCLPALPCGTHLYGAVQKNGAVAVEVPALRW